MFNYGESPDNEEIEISLFGPGYGEAVAIHLGEGAWLLVDSCREPESKLPATIVYLERIGVTVQQVKAIVASHWHDDHIGGFSELVKKFPEAEFCASSVFRDNEASAFLSAYCKENTSGLSGGTDELYKACKERSSWVPVQSRSIVFHKTLNSKDVLVTALSPVPAACKHVLARMSARLAEVGESIPKIPELKHNLESVAIHIDLGDDAILLGADLENHRKLGWSAVVADRWSGSVKPASAYKVAHHGSYNGDCPGVWRSLLVNKPEACLTPFTLGRHRLPENDDIARLKRTANKVHISSAASRKPDMDSRQVKRLGDICKKLTKIDTRFGAVRLRKHIGAAEWGIELFGAGRTL